jgi:hypothetical protein
MRWLSSISISCFGPRSRLLFTPKLRTTSSWVLLALQKFAYELCTLVVVHLIPNPKHRIPAGIRCQSSFAAAAQ